MNPLNNYEASLKRRGYSVIKEPARSYRCERCGGVVSDMDIHDKYHLYTCSECGSVVKDPIAHRNRSCSGEKG